MGTIQVPGRLSGRTYTINIKGDTPSPTEQDRIRSFVEQRESQFAQRYQEQLGKPLAEPEDGTALGRGWELGKAGAYSRLGTTTEYLGRGLGLESLVNLGKGMRQEGDLEYFLETMRQPEPTRLEDVTGLGSALTYAGEGIGQSGPEMLAPLAATTAGTIVGGPAVGLAAGAATAFPSFFGGNIQRQEESVRAGKLSEIDVSNAVIGAVGQSALNSIGDKLLLGGFLKPGQKWLTRTAVGGAEGAAVEVPTEIAQQIIERKQAGLPLDNDEAINEYINAGILGGIMGGGVRATTAGLGVGMERPAAPPAPPTVTPPTLGLPAPAKPGVAKVSGVETADTATVVTLSDGAQLTLDPAATEADVARAVDEYNQTKQDAEKAAKPAPTPKVEAPAKADRVPDVAYEADLPAQTSGVSVDADLAEARAIYDERLAIAEEGGADPEEAKRIAAQATVNYVDSLQADTKKRLERFRSTMARIASPSRGVMQPDLPDEAYAAEFGEAVQKDLFAPKAEPVVEPVAETTPAPAAPARPKLKPIPYDQYARKPDSNELIPGTNVRGEGDIIDLGGRKIVIREVNGVPVPFYLSSGLAGKKDVAAGKWYPILGIGPDGWINKGSQQEINDYYGSPELRSAAEELDATIGDIRSDISIPKVKPSGAHIDAINAGLSPTANQEVDTRDKFNANLANLLARIKAGRAQSAPEVTPQPEVTADVATPAKTESGAVGAGPVSGEPSVGESGQPAGDILPAGEPAASEAEGLGGGLPLPVGADTAARAEPDTLTQLEERLTAARVKAAELRAKVPAGLLERNLVGGKVDPQLPKKISNLRNVLARQQAAVESARAKFERTKVAGATRDGRLKAYEDAIAKSKATQGQLAALQEELSAAELAAGLGRAAVPKTEMSGKAQEAYTAYFNAMQDADVIRQQLEAERARIAKGEPEPAPLPTGLREPVIEDTFLTYQRGFTSKPVPPSQAVEAVAADVRKEGVMRRLVQFFMQRATPSMKLYTTSRGAINNPEAWKLHPDWVPLDDQAKVVQLLGRLNRAERDKYKFTLAEVEPLSREAEAAHTYFSKTVRPVDAIDMMIADLDADYEIYEGSLRPGRTEIEVRDLLAGTGSEVAQRALKWVRDNLSAETNAEIDLILAKEAEAAAVTQTWLEGDRVEAGREQRKAARKERAEAAAESGYDAVSIVREMAAGDARVALQEEMHYSVKAALAAGDLKGALQALAATTSNPELKALANRFSELTGTTRVRVLYPGDSAKHIGQNRGTFVQQTQAGYDPDYENVILINGQTGMTNHVLMHEMAHAVTSNLIDNQPNHPIVKQLEELLNVLRKAGPPKGWYTPNGRVKFFTYPTDFYGLTSVSEMVAEAYGRSALGETDNGLRDLMKRTKFVRETQVQEEVPLNAWERFKEIMGNLFNAVMRRPPVRYPRRMRTKTVSTVENAQERLFRLVDGVLSEAPQIVTGSVLADAQANPTIARNLLNTSVRNAPIWNKQGRARLSTLMSSSVPKSLRRALLGLLQLDWFNDLAGSYFPQIAKLKVLDDQRRGKIGQLNANVKPVLEDVLAYAQKSPELYATLAGIQGQATLAEVDPTEPVSKYSGDQEKTRVWHDLNRQLNAADGTGEMRNLFRKTRNVFRSYRAEIERVLKSRIKDITDDTVKQNQLFAQLMQKLNEENAIDPYFALMRKGDFWLEYTAEDPTAEPTNVDPLGRPQRPTTRYVQAFETPFALAQFRAKLEAGRSADGGPLAWDIEENPQPRSDLGRQGYVPPAFVQGALNIIAAFDRPGASPEERAKIDDARDAIHSMFLRLTPDHSLLKSLMKRKGTRGFIGDITPLGVIDSPNDIVQTLAEKTSSLAYQLANIEYGGKIQALINSAGDTRNKLATSKALTIGEKMAVDAYHDEFVARATTAKNPQVSGAAQFARGITFNMTLGFSIAGAANNLMQIPMIGFTELAGRYGGPAAAMRELRFAMASLKNAGKTQKVLSYGPDGRELRTVSNVDNFGSVANYFEPDEKGVMRLRTDIEIPAKVRDKVANLDVLAEVLANNGMLSASMSQEMLEAESGWLHKINRWGGFLMHHAERFNRQTMAIATYNLELKNARPNPSREAKLAAAQKAIEVTERVNGTIGASTAPRFAQSSVGSVLFMFKRFGLHMARYIIGTANQALRGASPEDRAVARYQIIGMLGTTALFAGVQGLPFFSELMTLFNVFFTDDDEERPEVIIQKFLGEPYYHGALNYLLGIEVASRISMSGLIFRENKIEKDQSALYDLFEMFGGPAVGVFMNTERGVQLLSEGEFYRGVETMMPSALKSILKSYRFATEGATTLRGDEIVPLTPVDIARQFLGYTPEAYARQQERVSGAKRIDTAVREKKRKLLRKYNLALRDADYPEVRDILREMMEFSRKYPEDAITADTINRSQRSFLQRSEEMISGVSFSNSGRARAEGYIGEFDPETSVWQ